MIIQEVIVMPAVRITPQEAYTKVKAGQAILVCGYEEEEKFKAMRLEGAVSFAGFQALLPSLPKDREIIFYCA
jgi:rhodanese-related sulfurtransferase